MSTRGAWAVPRCSHAESLLLDIALRRVGVVVFLPSSC